MAFSIRRLSADDQEGFEAAKRLMLAHREALGADFCFEGFLGELASVAEQYGPPDGCLLVAEDAANTPVGCIALRWLEPGVCEMKRMYLVPQHRGKGLGRALALTLLDEAKRLGYTKMKLDTLEKLEPAVSLYRSLGFTECPSYNDNWLEGILFMELALA